MRGFFWSGTDARMCNLYTRACTLVHLVTVHAWNPWMGRILESSRVLFDIYFRSDSLTLHFLLLFNRISSFLSDNFDSSFHSYFPTH